MIFGTVYLPIRIKQEVKYLLPRKLIASTLCTLIKAYFAVSKMISDSVVNLHGSQYDDRSNSCASYALCR